MLYQPSYGALQKLLLTCLLVLLVRLIAGLAAPEGLELLLLGGDPFPGLEDVHPLLRRSPLFSQNNFLLMFAQR